MVDIPAEWVIWPGLEMGVGAVWGSGDPLRFEIGVGLDDKEVACGVGVDAVHVLHVD